MDIHDQVRQRAQELKAMRTGPVRESDSAPMDSFGVNRYLERMREEDERNKQLVAAHRREQIAKLKQEWHNRIEDRWRDASLSKIVDPEYSMPIEDRLQRHANRDGMNRTSLVISGHMGRGKTYLGYAYAYELIDRGLMLPSQIFFDTERTLASISNSGYEKANRMEALLNPHYRFFLIDDVGRGSFSTPAMRGEIWYELINHIYTRRLTLVITTNLISSRDPEAKNTIAHWLGDAAVDRLRHMTGRDGNIIMKGEDMRTKKGEEWEARWQKSRNS